MREWEPNRATMVGEATAIADDSGETMNKFIIGTFAILGWAFWSLSGGADFEPQSRMAEIPTVETEETPTIPVAPAVLAEAAPQDSDPVAEAVQTVDASTDGSSAADTVVARADTSDLGQLSDSPAGAAPAVQPVGQDLAAAPRTPGSETSASSDNAPVFASLSGSDAASAGLNPIREVSARAVNMRDGPGTGFAVIDTLPQGTEAEIMAADGTGWVRVFIPATGMTGWMAERLLTEG